MQSEGVMRFSHSMLRAVIVVLALAVSANAGRNDSQPTRGRFVKVANTPAARAATASLSPMSAYDYGTFRWLELSEADFAALALSPDEIEDHTDTFALHLGGISFDPLRGAPALQAGWEVSRATGADLRLVQFVGPTRADWLTRLEGNGVHVVQYIHPYTYVVWCESAALTANRAASEIRWSGDFVPAYKVQPQWRNTASSEMDARVMVFRGADVDRVIAEMEAMGAKIEGRGIIDATFESVRLVLPADKLNSAVSVSGVYSLRPIPTDGGLRGEMSDQINVGNYDGTNLAFVGYQTYLTNLGINGAGVVIANVDSGVQNNHADLVGRLVACVGSTCGGATSSSHGTHTAGIMAGDAASGTVDVRGFKRGLGVAPGANLVEQLYSPTFQNPGGMLLLMTQSYNNGAELSGNSWGPAGSPLGYDDDTREVDVGVRDADPGAAGNQPLTYVLSFMNGNGGTSSQGTPDEGKNMFTIGSTKMQNSGSGTQILQIDDISSNSAHGPALDGRTIPHMVAPGCYVDSTTTTSTYTLLCGTSMASPHVSGAVALFFQYYRGLPGFTSDPSPALVKAAFLPVAHDLATHLDADGGVLGHPFDSKQGWGRMNLDAVIDPAVSVRYFDNPQIFDNTGEQWSVTVAAADPSKPVKMMLVWTDAPGHGLGGATPAWNNNLDLEVVDGGNTYRGNVFNASGWSTTGGVADNKNNTEGVFVGPTAPGTYTVTVKATNISSDGIPNQGDATDQDFAFVCYNCAQNPGFTLVPSPTSVSICAPSDAVYTINVGQVMGFTDPVTLSVSGAPVGTTTNFSTNPVSTPGSSTLTISNTGAAAAGTYNVTINGVSGIINRSTAVTLKLNTAAPTSPTLNTPTDGAANQVLSPTLTWTPSAQAVTHDVQVATDAGFSNVVASATGLATGTFNVTPSLATGTTYYWRSRSTNLCGKGAWSAPFYFITKLSPSILLVDDDDNGPDVRSYYTTALDSLGWSYDVWNTNNTDTEPTAGDLSPYTLVIWFTGDEFGGACGPGAAGEAALTTWLSSGGKCFFISSQDYLWDRGGAGHNTPTTFMAAYLGLANPATSDVAQTTVTGSAGGPFAGLGPYALTYPFTNYSDRVSPTGPATGLSFTGNSGDAAIYKSALGYRTVYMGFPFEAIASATDRQTVMSRIVSNCAVPCPVAKGDMTASGGVNGADIALFTRCFVTGTPLTSGCVCADMNVDNAFTAADVTSFVNCLLGIACP